MWVIVYFNVQVRAAIRTINPREEKYIKPERKFKIAVSWSLLFVLVTEIMAYLW